MAVALYVGVVRDRLRRPHLELYFSEKQEPPYFQVLAYERYDRPIDFLGQIIYLQKPGLNVRVKIKNTGRSTAKNVEARVEKIVFVNRNNNRRDEQFYHPTTVNWSGEREGKPVDIVPDSHFFLDVFWAKSEELREVLEFNERRYRGKVDRIALYEILEKAIAPSGEVYWNVWIDTSYERGVAEKYDFEGEIIVHFIVNGENVSPMRFEAEINWKRARYKQPRVQMKQANVIVNND